MNRTANMKLTKEEIDLIYGALRAKQNTLDKLQKWAENRGMEAIAETAFEQRKAVAALLIKCKAAKE